MSTNDEPTASIPVPGGEPAVWVGWAAVVERLQHAITERCSSKPILVVECYPGVDGAAVLSELQQQLKPALALHASRAFHAPKRIETLTQSQLNKAKPSVAPNHPLTMSEFFDAERLWHARREIEDLREGLVLVVGCGASLIAWGHVLVFAKLTRSEAGFRLSQNDGSNLGLENHALPIEEKLRRALHVDWPVADRWKRPLITHWDFVLETKPMDPPKLFDGEAVQRGLQLAVQRPFRFAPTAPELIRATNQSHANPTWQEENLLLSFGAEQLELPALDLVLAHPRALLGDAIFFRHGFNPPLPLRFLPQPESSYVALSKGDNWVEDQAVLKDGRNTIELRRLRFERGVDQSTNGSLLALKLVEGPSVSVESPKQVFAPLVFRRQEPFIMPAAVTEFILRPAGLSDGPPWTILKAFVRMR